MREGFKDVDNSNSDIYRSDDFLDEECELENSCLSILNEVLVERVLMLKVNIGGRCGTLQPVSVCVGQCVSVGAGHCVV